MRRGLPERILNRALARRGQEAPPKKYVACFLPGASTQILVLTNRPNKKTPTSGVFLFGLPERIRTFDLQSRSLTRYPAVPRVGISYTLVLYHKLRKNATLFSKKVWATKEKSATNITLLRPSFEQAFRSDFSTETLKISPQPVENSVDIFPNFRKDLRKIRTFGDFCRVKSNLGAVE